MQEKGAQVTFSMSKKQWPWLEQALSYNVPLESGRAVLIPEFDLIYSAFKVQGEKEVRVLKTVSTAFGHEFNESDEATVLYVTKRRSNTSQRLEYFTTWSTGDTEWASWIALH